MGIYPVRFHVKSFEFLCTVGVDIYNTNGGGVFDLDLKEEDKNNNKRRPGPVFNINLIQIFGFPLLQYTD